MSDVVQKLWGFCHTLRHDGIDYGDYIEQITYLLFLKMSDERGIDLAKVKMRAVDDPKKTTMLDCSWPALTSRTGTDLTDYYANVLRALGQQEGLLGNIFSGAQSRFSKPTNLKKLLTTIDETEWTTLEVNVKADAFEGLLEKAASEGKKGAGQYFTPRLLIQSIVRCMKPDPRASKDYKICDPACGTGEFLVSAYEWVLGVTKNGADLDRATAKRVKTNTYFGQDLVPRPRRLALMNLYLHNLEPRITLGDSIYDPPPGDRIAHLRPMNVNIEEQIALADLKYVPAEKVDNDRKLLKRGDVLFNNTNSTELVGKTAVYEDAEPRAFSNHMTRIRVLADVLDPAFCAAYLHHQWREGHFQSVCNQHVSQSSVSRTVLMETPISLPPLAEQERIVAKVEALLDRVNKARERLDRVPDILKRFRQSVLAAACSGRLTADWREEENPNDLDAASELLKIRESVLSSFTKSRDRNLYEAIFDDFPPENDVEGLPDTWLSCRVGHVGQIFNGSTPSRKKPEYWGPGVPWVSSGEVQNNIIRETREEITKKGFAATSRRLLPTGTVLIAMIGEGKTRGQSAILEIEATINQNMAAIDIRHGGVEPRFLWYWFQFQYLLTREQGGGSGPQALNCQRVRELPLVLPPKAEQAEIIRRVDCILTKFERLESFILAGRKRVDFTTQSVLAKAFAGELVETEAELARREGRRYEPASELLKRIAAGQKAHENGKPKRPSKKKAKRATKSKKLT